MVLSITPPALNSKDPLQKKNNYFSINASVRGLLESLSSEQIKNQELLASLVFALRSFTNLNRFLEIIPLIASRLTGLDGCLLIPFHLDGRIHRELIQGIPTQKANHFITQLIGFKGGDQVGFAFSEVNLTLMDKFVQRYFGNNGLSVTSIFSRGSQRGRLYVFKSDGPLAWSDVHKKNFQLVADLTGVGIENNLYLEEHRLHERVDRQISIGGEIQAQLLPDYCPVIEGIELSACCRPAFQVGGDYYDFMPTRPELIGKSRENGRWAFVIGDVMGKGIPAGLLMTMLRGMLRAEVLTGLPPDKILHDLNQLALDDLAQSHRFVTLFYSDFDPRSRRLRYANAAHNPPLLWKSFQKTVSRLDAPGLLIGLEQDADYLCNEVILEPGDIILYYTDGVTEALGMTGDRFNESRLISLLESIAEKPLGAKEILDFLFKKLDSFIGPNHHLEDDASMIVLKVTNDLSLPHIQTSHA